MKSLLKWVAVLAFALFIFLPAPFYYNPFLEQACSPPLYLICIDSAAYSNNPFFIRRDIALALKKLSVFSPRAFFLLYPLHYGFSEVKEVLQENASPAKLYLPLGVKSFKKKSNNYFVISAHLPLNVLSDKIEAGHLLSWQENNTLFVPKYVLYKKEKFASLYQKLVSYYASSSSFPPHFSVLPFVSFCHKSFDLRNYNVWGKAVKNKAVFVFLPAAAKEKFMRVFASVFYNAERWLWPNRIATLFFLVVILFFCQSAGESIKRIFSFFLLSVLVAGSYAYFLSLYRLYPDMGIFAVFISLAFLTLALKNTFSFRLPKPKNFTFCKYIRKTEDFASSLEGMNYNSYLKAFILLETYNASQLAALRLRARSLLLKQKDPKNLDFYHLNSFVRKKKTFLNLSCVVLDSKEKKFVFYLAGCEPLFVLKAGKWEIIKSQESFALGVRKDARVKKVFLSWQAIEKICLFNSRLRKIKGGLMSLEDVGVFLSRKEKEQEEAVKNSNIQGGVVLACLKRRNA